MNKNYNRDHKTLCIFPSATCNLSCVYCNIEKNEHLVKIDKIIADSFADENYYFDFVKKIFPYRFQLERLETWGGEPFLHIERIYGLLHKLIEYYPFFRTFYSSTNFSFPEWPEKAWGIIEEFGKHPGKDFQIEFQLSIDGPEALNDYNRGKGVTKKCLKNFNVFINQIKERLPKNIHLHFAIKNTLNLENIKELNSIEKIVEYYSFFEKNIIQPLIDLKFQVGENMVSITPGIPNMASPMPATKLDGIRFKEFVKNCRTIEKNKMLKYHKSVTPFCSNEPFVKNSYKKPTCGCGDGFVRVGLLPKYYITSCNEGFLYIDGDYLSLEKEKTDKIIKSANNCLRNLCMTENQYSIYQEKTRYFINESATSISSNTASYIHLLAACGQIDEKYLNIQEAIKAGNYITSNLTFCIKDNYGVTGSKSLVPDGHLKLLLNGALDYILEED